MNLMLFMKLQQKLVLMLRKCLLMLLKFYLKILINMNIIII